MKTAADFKKMVVLFKEAALKKKKHGYLTVLIYLIIFAALFIFIISGSNSFGQSPDELDFDAFFALIQKGLGENYGDPNSEIYAVQVTDETLYGLYNNSELTEEKKERFEKGKEYDFSVNVGKFETFTDEMAKIISAKYGVEAEKVSVLEYGFNCRPNPRPKPSWLLTILPYVITLGGLVLVFVLINKAQGGGKQAMSFAKSKAKTADELGNTVTFADVAGADEEKQELREIVDFLRSPKAFIEMGARIPKGVLLVGPPGTGKTLLAKAVAGEANVPFFSISSSEFVELYVGVGASRVRDLFTTAKRSAPAIIFIDEIDAVGRQRGTGLGGGHDEREQTLNQLLVEMDGFSNSEGIIVMAATNRADVLDPALLRPGRFDRRITVDYPDVKGREEILKVHARKKTFAENVSFERIAKLTPGCTGADLENILNEAAILAVRGKRKAITEADIDEGVKRVLYGPEKKSRVIKPEDLKATAYHEVGHAVVAHCLPKADKVHELSIIPRGRAAGYTRMIPGDTYEHVTKNKLLDEIAVFMGGRAAERLFLDDISTGASNDLMNATNMARDIIASYGMSDTIGPVYLAGEQEIFIGKNWGQQQNYSEDLAAKMDDEIRKIVETQQERAERILKDHVDGFERVVKYLLKHEQITGDEFTDVFENNLLSVPSEEETDGKNANLNPAPAGA